MTKHAGNASIPAPPVETLTAPVEATGSGTVIFNEPQGAEVWVDHKFVGSVSSKT